MNDLHSLPTSLREQLQTISDRISPPPSRPTQTQAVVPAQTQLLVRNDEAALAPAIAVIAQSNPELAALIIAARYGARAIEFEDLDEETKVLTTRDWHGNDIRTEHRPYQQRKRTVRSIRLVGPHTGEVK